VESRSLKFNCPRCGEKIEVAGPDANTLMNQVVTSRDYLESITDRLGSVLRELDTARAELDALRTRIRESGKLDFKVRFWYNAVREFWKRKGTK